jgi:hypothetical protein
MVERKEEGFEIKYPRKVSEWHLLDRHLRDCGKNLEGVMSVAQDKAILGQLLIAGCDRVNLHKTGTVYDAMAFTHFALLTSCLVNPKLTYNEVFINVGNSAIHFSNGADRLKSIVALDQAPLYSRMVHSDESYLQIGEKVELAIPELKEILPQTRPSEAAKVGAGILLGYLKR